MPEKIEPQIAGGDPVVEEYFGTQFGVDKTILIGVMLQFKNLERELVWEKLNDSRKGALNRLAIYSNEAGERKLLSEKEAEFLVQVGTGQVPPLGSRERERFDKATERTGLVKGGLPLEGED